MLGAILLFESDFTNIVSITFTSLILSELINVASEITSWSVSLFPMIHLPLSGMD